MDFDKHTIFISYAHADYDKAEALVTGLERCGVRCFIAPRDLRAGADWANAITNALDASRAVVVVLSAASDLSAAVAFEAEFAANRNIPVIACRTEDFVPSGRMAFLYGRMQLLDRFDPREIDHIQQLVQVLRQLHPGDATIQAAGPIAPPAPGDSPKGYVFISYVRVDADFVQALRSVFEAKDYGYWDYFVGNRDYHGVLYRELEERIDNAVAFMTIVSDDWRRSDWVASEFIYAREAQIPIFVIQAKALTRPLPIMLNLQTRIDMSGDFEVGKTILLQELAKKRL
jgi:hypothetical protein